jgi:HTH-type transcriptional regulator, quorum sensing regulator NprR
MEKQIGERLKFFRKKLGMTQSELSKGIISVSYLSKIENGKIIPPEEIMELLTKRLGLESLSSRKDNDMIIEECKEWFYLLLKRDEEEAIRFYSKINKSWKNIMDTNLERLVEIHKLQYFVITNDKEEARKQLSTLLKNEKSWFIVKLNATKNK